MKLHLVKEELCEMDNCYPYWIEPMYLEGQELEEKLRDYLTRFVAGTLDPEFGFKAEEAHE